MIKTLLKTKILPIVAALTLTVWAALPLTASAAGQMTARSMTLTSSAISATNVGYTFAFTPPTSTTIKSVRIDICDSASGTCTQPTNVPAGFSSTSAAVGTITGIGSGGSWTGTFTTNGRIDLANNSNTGSPTNVSIQITGITNPSTPNAPFYARMTTYSASNWTGVLDTGTVVGSTAGQISLTGSVDESLTFCAGVTGNSINFGTFSATTASTATSMMGAGTNASGGYVITVNGTTLTSGANTIAALASQTASSTGTAQFGANLVANTSPSVFGSNPSGGSGAASANYATTNQYRFVTGDTVANSASSTAVTTYTVAYLVNISTATLPGIYSTTLTYICTATF